AGAGIGRLMCLEFAQYCPTLIGLDMNKDTLNETARAVVRLGGPVLHTYVCDLRSRDDINQTVARVLREVGRVTILVNNAGVVSGKRILDLKPVDIDDTFQVNVISHIYMLQALLPSMMGSDGRVEGGMGSSGSAPRGHIVTIASLASVIPNPGFADYCASKAAALMLSDALELELSVANLEKHIHVTRVCPFFINTQMFEGCRPSMNFEGINHNLSPLKLPFSEGHYYCIVHFKVKEIPEKNQVSGTHRNLSCVALLIDYVKVQVVVGSFAEIGSLIANVSSPIEVKASVRLFGVKRSRVLVMISPSGLFKHLIYFWPKPVTLQRFQKVSTSSCQQDDCTLLFRSRLSWLFPIVDADYCVRQIVKAVRANERLVFIHRWQFLLAVLYCKRYRIVSNNANTAERQTSESDDRINRGIIPVNVTWCRPERSTPKATWTSANQSQSGKPGDSITQRGSQQ
ncbi:epidermal retinol dehydrogenase 2, partial [Clonorchis sinensis]